MGGVSAMSHLSSSSLHQTLPPHPADLAQACAHPALTPALTLASPAAAPPAVPSIGSFAASAISAKSFPSSLTSLSTPQAPAQPLGSRDGRDNREKHGSTPSSAPIDSVQKANFISASSPIQLVQSQQQQSSAAAAGAAQNVSAPIGDDSSPSSSTLTSAPTALPLAGNLPDAFVGSFPTLPAPASSSALTNSDSEMKDAVESAAASAAASATSSASSADATSTASLTKRIHARIAEVLAQQAAASAASSASSAAAAGAASSSSAASAAVCHCLMLDGSRFAAGSEQAKQLQAAFASSSAPATLVSQLADWLKLDAADISAAYTEPAHRRIHINFRSLDALSSALRAAPLLMRCNAERSAATQWVRQPAMQCGAKREEQQELVQLSSTLIAVVESTTLMTDIAALLASLEIDSQCFWLTPKNKYADRADKADSVTINLLPRDIRLDALTALVSKLSTEWNLYGGSESWFVHAPRQPTLERCRTCKQLNHNASRCSLYNFPALRLLGKKPLPYSFLQHLIALTGARSGYLAANLDERAPHCKLTLLFDGDAEDADTQQQLIDRVALLYGDRKLNIAPLLLELPCIVKPTQRHSECKQCNHNNGAHECPLAQFGSYAAPRNNSNRRAAHGPASDAAGVGVGAAARQANSSARASNTHHSSSAAGSSAPRMAHDPSDKMCRGWRARKRCPAAADGKECKWEHPDSHVPVCGDFQQGKCTRERCRFSHAAPAQQPQQQPAASAATNSAAAAPASAAAPAASAPQPAGSAAAPAAAATRGPVMHAARRGRAGAGGRASAAASKHNSPARHASPATRPAAAAPSTPKSSPRKKRGRHEESKEEFEARDELASSSLSPPRLRSKKAALGLTASLNSFASLADTAGMELEDGEIPAAEEKAAHAQPAAAPAAVPSAPPPSSLASLPPPTSNSAHIPTKTASAGKPGVGAVEARNNEVASSKTAPTAASGMPPPAAAVRSPSNKGKKDKAKAAMAAAAAASSSHQRASDEPAGL